MSPGRRLILDGLLKILRTGEHPDGRRLGPLLAARLRALAERLPKLDAPAGSVEARDHHPKDAQRG